MTKKKKIDYKKRAIEVAKSVAFIVGVFVVWAAIVWGAVVIASLVPQPASCYSRVEVATTTPGVQVFMTKTVPCE